MPALHVLTISGSTRAGSLNAQLLRAAAAALPPSVELVELDPALIKAIPAFDEDDEARAGGDDIPALRMMRDQIAEADAVLFATPEYNALARCRCVGVGPCKRRVRGSSLSESPGKRWVLGATLKYPQRGGCAFGCVAGCCGDVTDVAGTGGTRADGEEVTRRQPARAHRDAHSKQPERRASPKPPAAATPAIGRHRPET